MNIIRRGQADDAGLKADIPDPLLRQLLARRGIKSSEQLCPDLDHLLHYRDLKDIQPAAAVIADAVMHKQHIMVAGDYDVDGMTGTALGVKGLQQLGAVKVSAHVPSRYDDGYGLSVKTVDKAAALGVNLIITVDNGIGSVEAAAQAKAKGIALVITDHHVPPAVLPEAAAVVDPKRKDCNFGSKNLCGVGVLFYVLLAVRAELKTRNFYPDKIPAMDNLLDLVAVGTIGDVVDLDDNNRRLVRAGLVRMRSGKAQAGLLAICHAARVNLSEITPVNIAFDICPRLNAAGRIKLTDNPAVTCLLASDLNEAEYCARRLDNCNRRRSDYERVFLQEAKQDALQYTGAKSLVLFRPHWLSGISGLLAGRLKEQYKVPCFIFAGNGEEIIGSARSVHGFPLAQILTAINEEEPGLMLRFGGHAMAAGATIRACDIDKFRACFEAKAAACIGNQLGDEVLSDGPLPADHANVLFAKSLESAGPWGPGFPEPCFDGEFTIQNLRLMANRHLRMQLCDGKIWLDAIKFRANAWEKALTAGMQVRVTFTLAVDRYREERLEAHIDRIEPI